MRADPMLLTFLWDKWRYHDDLLHRREGHYWSLEVGYLGLVATLASINVDVHWFWLSPLVLGLALLAWNVSKQRLADRQARNSFNQQLISTLGELQLIERSAFLKDDEHLEPTMFDHTANNWHLGPHPAGYPGGLAKSLIDSQVGQGIMLVVNAALAAALIRR